MGLWGAICGGVLGLLWPGGAREFHLVVGAVLGALAGMLLRRALAGEVEAAVRKQLAGLASPVVAPQRHEDLTPRAAATPESGVVAHPAAIVPVTSPPAQAAPAATGASVPVPPRTPTLVERLVARARDWLFGGNTIVRMGLLVLFVGLSFLAKYAAEHALLPPQLRLAAIAAAGIGLFATGWRMVRRNPGRRAQALSLQGAGVAVLYLTVFAAFRLYQFLPAGAAFGALALVCAFSTAIALAQDAPAMAFIGFAGGFAAPVLVSTGQGSHVALFSYYLLLGIAIVGIAWFRAWRALNLLGFFSTFAVATAWSVLRYRPELFASTEPFLVAFFLVYVAAAVLYATRHALATRRAVDGSLVFGVPLLGFGLQAALVRDIPFGAAFSALAVGAFYLALGSWAAARGRRGSAASTWLAECFAPLGLGFVTLAVPLALDARWTSAVWAVEGAAVYWLGHRQDRWLARLAGLVLQVLAAVSYLGGSQGAAVSGWPFANPAFIGAAMLTVSALALAWWTRDADPTGRAGMEARMRHLERALSPALLWVGFLWSQFGLGLEIDRMVPDVFGVPTPLLPAAQRMHLALLAWVGAAYALHRLALPTRARPWPVAATPAWTVVPVLLAGAVVTAFRFDHVFVEGGWAVWPLLLVLHVTMLRRLDAGEPGRWWPLVHAGGAWLLVLLLGNVLAFAIGRAHLWQTAWASVLLLVAATVVLLVLAHPAWYAAQPRRWPLDRFARAYAWIAAAPLALGLAAGSLLVALLSDGDARPLPYLPLLNPTDLSIALALAACALWLLRLRRGTLRVPQVVRGTVPPLALAAVGFVALNTAWLRLAHHVAGVPWHTQRLLDSFLVQAGLSILWTVLALALMVVAGRRAWRGAWITGGLLLAATVAKLFLVDLSNRGGAERIVVFIAVGLLMLVVGHVAPLPPAGGRALRPQEAAS